MLFAPTLSPSQQIVSVFTEIFGTELFTFNADGTETTSVKAAFMAAFAIRSCGIVGFGLPAPPPAPTLLARASRMLATILFFSGSKQASQQFLRARIPSDRC